MLWAELLWAEMLWAELSIEVRWVHFNLQHNLLTINTALGLRQIPAVFTERLIDLKGKFNALFLSKLAQKCQYCCLKEDFYVVTPH